MKTFDWIIVGGGITGISLSEILSREGHSVALIEKNNKLASETTREFHEWFHTGSLYTLVKDKMKTLKYILGSLDDLLEFYTSFPRMNLRPSENGLKIIKDEKGWFNSNYINFKYRIKNRKFIIPWIYAVSRSIALIEGIRKHDWLRRRAGILESVTSEYYIPILKNLLSIILSNKKQNSVILNYDECSDSFFKWYQQLVAESLGKKSKGIFPIISTMPKDNHSLMQYFLDGPKKNFYTFFSINEKKSIKLNNKNLLLNQKKLYNKNINEIINAQKAATEKVFLRKKIPFRSFTINQRSEKSLGALFSFFILETILLGRALKVNPFDQPAVGLIKSETKKLF